MGKRRWWVVVMMVVLLTGTTSALWKEFTDAQKLERDTLKLLTPILGDVDAALVTLIDPGKVGLGVDKFIKIVVDQMFNVSPNDVDFVSSSTMRDRKLLGLFQLLSRRLDLLENGAHGIISSLRDVGKERSDLVRWEIALDTMEEYIQPINTLYKRFLLYQNIKEKASPDMVQSVEDHTLRDFANSVLSHDHHCVMASMTHLHSLAAPEGAHGSNSPLLVHSQQPAEQNNPKDVYVVSGTVAREIFPNKADESHTKISHPSSLFFKLHQALQMSDRCYVHQSPQQIMRGLYTVLSLTQARGYAMLEFARMVLRAYNEGNFTAEQRVSKGLYLQYSEDMLREARKLQLRESQDFLRCDPPEHQEGKTYVQLTELLQGYIENEVDMNVDGTCIKTCEYYQHTKSEGCHYQETKFCGKQRQCLGTIHDCQYNDADAWICQSQKPYRRYDYIRYENGLQLGGSNSCAVPSLKVDSWIRWFVRCAYCLCLCDDGNSPTTDRYISLTPAITDTRNNMIVTGVRFTKQRRVIHLQVQQGQALPQGQVNVSTIHWVDVEPINVFRSGYEEGNHYMKLSYENRSVDLDRLTAPVGHVVTGVRLRMLGSHVNLEVQITPISFTSGELKPYKSYWISNDNTPVNTKNPRQQFLTSSPDDPTKFPFPSIQDSKPNTYMRFGPTDRIKDVAQLTVPFFDAQDVAPSPSTWFSGVELFHKGQYGSGGFLALKVITYDMTPYIDVTYHEPMTVILA
ncbi:uncharacterized protein LOC121880111 isoform X2 [Homarus americanus]|uniref:uncharacterized protein LOC121880111 isoform X2 n=1 Tax=Homarus americanus TaxID=6706 RepID=UPI001C4615F3|nr:uncharacterized protein LOC121880111 isoform X2 [Homarus americanus]